MHVRENKGEIDLLLELGTLKLGVALGWTVTDVQGWAFNKVEKSR